MPSASVLFENEREDGSLRLKDGGGAKSEFRKSVRLIFSCSSATAIIHSRIAARKET